MPDRRRRERECVPRPSTPAVDADDWDPSVELPALAEAVLASKAWSANRAHWAEPKCVGSMILFPTKHWLRAVAIRPPSVRIGFWHACVAALHPNGGCLDRIELYESATVRGVVSLVSLVNRELYQLESENLRHRPIVAEAGSIWHE